ncbi:Carbohydrate binding domain [Serratia ficaria]|uniref:phage gp6-like head-tail connector protein n=1 Tax=Serratia ficaria TaxID=61651 RepID=UPI0021837D84|nr:phage gp6-like head-tail connector protein [Serratia ficaria]CAI2496942.1 Carbohydrate binding domain [Serratia ficaria]
MNERELSLIKAISEEFGAVIKSMRQEFSSELSAQQLAFEEKITQLTLSIAELKEAAPDIETRIGEVVGRLEIPAAPELPDIKSMVDEAVTAAMPPPAQDGKSVTVDDVRPMLEELVSTAVAEIPVPVAPELPDIKSMVDEAVTAAMPPPAQDGKSVTVDDVRPMLEELVSTAVAEIPVPVAPELPDIKSMVDEAVTAAMPPPARDGEDGRDALQIEIMPDIDAEKSYPRGTYATHNGGLWRSFEKTAGMRGWECLVDGITTVDIEQDEHRHFTVIVERSSGASTSKSFDVPVMIYRGVFKSGADYRPGDTVTWGGSLWHCDEATSDKPGETGSKGWTLSVKRGRNASAGGR